jgi:hypothetical protein
LCKKKKKIQEMLRAGEEKLEVLCAVAGREHGAVRVGDNMATPQEVETRYVQDPALPSWV